MKIIFKIFTLCALLAGFSACNKQEPEVEQPLEVNYVNLHGTWKLEKLGGKPVGDEVYCYIELSRGDHSFKMYDNFGSMYARLNTGKFQIDFDEREGSRISGTYDYGLGKWNNEYLITELMPSGTMVWTNVDMAEDVQKFVRCDKVPDEIVEEARQIKK